MERIALSNLNIEGSFIDRLHLILDDYGNVITLPLLWTIHLSCTGCVFSWSKKGTFSNTQAKFQNSKHIADENTIDNYVGHVFHFLKYINELYKSKKTPSVHNTELVTTCFINYYLNSELPKKLQSISSLNAHQAAISAYFSFLYELEIKDIVKSTIYRKTRQLIAENDSRVKKINYVSKYERSYLLSACNSQRDRLIIRMGYEVGLRTEENLGLVLNDQKIKNKTQNGLLTLFDELNKFPFKQTFEYVLSGKFTKRGKTRNIYFDRNLLIDLKRYYDTERLAIMQNSGLSNDTLFVRMDSGNEGASISKTHGSNTFAKLREQCPHINQTLSYHDLRHTFATELYHAELADPEGRETRSESAALIVVSERLGHKSVSSTIRYIRLRQQMLIIENVEYE
jgi:integrase